MTADPSLKGAIISVTDKLPDISEGRLIIKGDIDADGDPDITINGGKKASECFYVRSSDVGISGFIIKNFTSIGIDVTANSDDGVQQVERATLFGNTISVKDREGIRIATSGRDRTIENVDVLQNRLFESWAGVSISAGWRKDRQHHPLEKPFKRQLTFVE